MIEWENAFVITANRVRTTQFQHVVSESENTQDTVMWHMYPGKGPGFQR